MYKKLEETIGLHFKNQELLQTAFVHRSYINEHKASKREHNERLEFLGDAVLELAVTEYLYKNFPNPEGDLTNWRSALVKRETLAQVAGELGLGKLLFLSRGEEHSGGREKSYLLANTLEALIGVIYLEFSYAKARDFIHQFLIKHLPGILKAGSHIDPKSRFQEMIQEKTGVTPNYKVLHEAGPDHDKAFTMGAYVEERLVGKGSGSSKQIAEQRAAEDALKRLK